MLSSEGKLEMECILKCSFSCCTTLMHAIVLSQLLINVVYVIFKAWIFFLFDLLCFFIIVDTGFLFHLFSFNKRKYREIIAEKAAAAAGKMNKKRHKLHKKK